MRMTIPHRGDDGMSLLELLIASAILLFAISAVFGLVLSSTNMSVSAKAHNIAVNAANSYIEYVRSIPYDQVGIAGTSVPGSLSPNATMTITGFQVSIETSVAGVNDPQIVGTVDYKRLGIVVDVVPQNGARVTSLTFTALIRRNDELQTPPDYRPPTIAFTGTSPSSGSGVAGSSVHMQVTARSNTIGGTIQDVYIFVDGNLLVAPDGITRSHWGGLNQHDGVFDIDWDTMLLDGGGARVLRDGPKMLKARVVDGIGAIQEVNLSVIVDNDPPTALSVGPSVIVSTDSTAPVTWGKAWDPIYAAVGSDCWGYVIDLRKQPTSATSAYSEWSSVGSSTVVGALSVTANTVALSRYYLSVTPSSIRSLYGPASGVAWVSSPRASGSYTVPKTGGSGSNTIYDVRNTVNLTPPTFANTARTYYLYRMLTPSGASSEVVAARATTLTATAAYSRSDWPQIGVNSGAVVHYYYRVRVDITPDNPGGGTSVTLWSNIIGPNGAAGSIGTFGDQGW